MEHLAKEQIINIVHAVEKERQIYFEPDEVSEVLDYTWAGIKAIGEMNRCHTTSVLA